MSDEEWVILFMLCGKAAEYADRERKEGRAELGEASSVIRDASRRLELAAELDSFVGLFGWEY
jgi:hypothetical protein